MLKSAFVRGLLFAAGAVGIVRLTSRLASEERRGKDSSIGLWVIGTCSTCRVNHNTTSTRTGAMLPRATRTDTHAR